MTKEDFIGLQASAYGITGHLYGQQHKGCLQHRLELGYINEQSILDLAAYHRTGQFVFDPELVAPENFTAGTGHPVRIVAYYDRRPTAYAVGFYEDSKLMLTFWECAREAPNEFMTQWLTLLIHCLENLAVALEAIPEWDQSVTHFAFTSPNERDYSDLVDCGMAFDPDFHKGIPACYVTRPRTQSSPDLA